MYIVKQDDEKETKFIYKYLYGGKQSYDKVPLLIRFFNAIIHKLNDIEFK